MSACPSLVRTEPALLLEGAGQELDALLSSAARARLLDTARAVALPPQIVCLECRLAEGDERVDLALCLAPHAARLEAALDALGRAHVSNERWRSAMDLLTRWASRGDATLAGIPFLFTAFDLTDDGAGLPVPCLSLCADPAFFLRRMGLPATRAAWDWPLQLFDACRASLGSEVLTPALRERATTCLAAVEDTEVRHLSLMLARAPATLKFDVTLPEQEFGRFLQVNDWQGNAAKVLERVRFLAPWQERIQVNFVADPVPELATSLEVEFCCTGPDEGTVEQRLALVERLVAAGLASAPKAAALAELSHRPVSTDACGRSVARNWYLKVRFDGERPSAAKAYIGLMERGVG